MTGWMTADEAMAMLGVKRRTLYTYASRGWISTRPLDGRSKLYRHADLQRLKQSATTHRSTSARAATALSWGEPILHTKISGIDRDGPYYRGIPALDLQDATLEDVAELLWHRPKGAWPTVELATSLPSIHELRRRVDGIERNTDVDQQARLLLRSIQAWCGLPSHPDLRAAHILCAEHGLNASTFTARVVASTGADLITCVVAALSAFSGPKHGTASIALARGLGNPIDLSLPGFGHPLYPDGDPRAVALLNRIDLQHPRLVELVAQIEHCAEQGVAPNLDTGLLAVCLFHDFPPKAAPLLFVVGRVIGWIAHIFEQKETPGLLRPRGHFVGW